MFRLAPDAARWGSTVQVDAVCFVFAFAPMGSANFPVSLSIAALKASLVGAIFMRLFEPNPLNRLVAVAGPIWIFVMFLLIGANYFTR
jgi:caa(3)-type oxidase subunit IV